MTTILPPSCTRLRLSSKINSLALESTQAVDIISYCADYLTGGNSLSLISECLFARIRICYLMAACHSR